MKKFIKYSIVAAIVTVVSACSDGRTSAYTVNENIALTGGSSTRQTVDTNIEPSPTAKAVAMNSSQQLAQSAFSENEEKCWFSRK